MKDIQFDKLQENQDNNSHNFNDDTCSVIWLNNDNIKSKALDANIIFRNGHTFTKLKLNIRDVAYIFDKFLDLSPEAINFFNEYIEYRGIKINKI